MVSLRTARNIKSDSKQHKAFGLLVVLFCYALGMAACSSSEPYELFLKRSDVPEMASISEYSLFGKNSPLLQLKTKPALQISQNHPTMQASPWHLNPIPSGVIQALYDNVDRDALADYVVFKSPTSRLKQGRDYADILFYGNRLLGLEYDTIEFLQGINPNLKGTYIAKDALVFFTHKDNPISDLSLSQIQDIYSGKTTNWQMLGGNNEIILPYQRQRQGSSLTLSQKFMESDVMKGLKMLPSPMHRITSIAGYSGDEVIEYKNQSGALGYCTRWSLEMVVPPKKRKEIKILSVDGIFPDEENIHSGRYPLAYDIVAYAVKLEVSQETEAVISWLVSPEGKQYLSQLGYVPS